MKNSLIKVLSFVMALTMIVGCFSAITFSAAEHTHTKGEQVGDPVPATCANIGYTLYKCATCGETYPDDVVPKAADHTGIVEVPATEASCAYPAMTAGKKCTDCGTVIDASEVVEGSKPLGHNFVGAHKGNVCDLVYYYTCAVCGKTAEECYKAEKEDDFDETKYGVNIEKYREYFAKDKGEGHKWDYAVKTAPETCKDGLTVATCKTCGTVKEITVNAKHSFTTKTFLSCEGYVGIKCDLCGAPAPTATVNNNPTHTWVDVTIMNSTLQGMGYKTVRVPATCTAAGYQIQKCACGEYRENTLPATGHTYGAWTSEGGTKVNGNPDVCVSAKTLTRKCTKCDAQETTIGVALKEHILVSDVTDSTCTAEGYTTLKCIYPACTYEVTTNYTAALGHSFGDWETVGSANNHATDYKKVRTCARCSAKEEQVIIAAITPANAPANTVKIGDHYFIDDDKADTVVAANCKYPAYSAYVCVVDGCGATTPVNGTPEASKINDDKNTSVHDASVLTKLYTVKAPTCTATGLDKYICTNCNNVEVDVTVPAKGHDDPSQWVNYRDANNNNKVDSGESLAAVPATCTSTGKTEGLVCKSCKTIMVAQKTTPIDPNNHKTLSNGSYVPVTPTLITDRTATCSSVGYKVFFYSCCKQYVTEYPADPAYSNIKADAHVWKEVDYKAATCGVNGNHAYRECKECGRIEITCTCEVNGVPVDHTDLPVEIVATPHHFVENESTKAKQETCTEAGYTAHKVCDKCGVTEGKVIIPAHGNSYKVVFKDTTTTGEGINTYPTHTETGIKAGKFCSVCDKKPVAEGGYVISAKGHDASFSTPVVVNAKSSDDYDCTLPTYNVYACSCGVAYADTYVAAVASEHIYEAVWHKYTIKDNKLQLDGKDVDPTVYACDPTAFTYEYRRCQNCDQIEKKNIQAPINHYDIVNGTKVDILLDCKNIENYIGLVCEICTREFQASDVTHNATFSKKDPTCTEAGYNLKVCADCGKYLDIAGNVPENPEDALNTVIPALGHKPYVIDNPAKPYGPNNFRPSDKNLWAIDTTAVKYVVEEKAPTFGADGYIKYMCANCNEVVTYVIPYTTGIELGMTATPGFTGNQVAVTITVSAKDFKFQTMMLGVFYDRGLVLSNKKPELNYEFPVDDNVTVVAKDNDGYVVVTIYAPNSADTGKAKNTVISGEDAALVTLYFDVLPYAKNAGFALEVGEIYDAVEDEDITDYYFDADTINSNNELIDYKTTLVGDANGDGWIDAADSVAVMEANYTAVYNAALDFNADGTVDLDDHMALVNYYTSGRTYFDFLELIGVDYMDYVNNYDLRVDLDGDRTVTDNDRNRIAIELVDELKHASVEYGNAFDINDMIDDIVKDLLNDGLRNHK